MSQEAERPTGSPDPAGHAPPPRDEPDIQPEAIVESSSPTPAKADLTKRIVAGIIDAVVAVVVGLIPIVGGLVATAYWLVRDGLDVEFMPNRSLGKKVAGLQPVTLDGRPVDIQTSVMRNWPFAVGGVAQILLFIPVIGWLLMLPVALVALGLVLVELFLVVTDDEGRRLGDKTADTRVIEVGGGML